MVSRSPKVRGNFGGCMFHWKALWVTAVVYAANKINNGISVTAAANCIAADWPVSRQLFPSWKIRSLFCSLSSIFFYCFLPTHSNRQGVDLLVTVCLCVCVCTVTDFSGEDKASGVKFCTVVYRRAGQGISNFAELCSPRSPKSDESAIVPPWLTRLSSSCGVWTWDRHVWIYGRSRRRTYLSVFCSVHSQLLYG